MTAKLTVDGKPNVLFLEGVLNESFGERAVYVICISQIVSCGTIVRWGRLCVFIRAILHS
jgi:hypothetical protein